MSWAVALPPGSPMVVAAGCLAGVLLAAIWTRPALYLIEGPSMLPTLEPGTLALGIRAYRVRPGQIVVARDPLGPGLTVKRVTYVRHPSLVWLVGDNMRCSADSRTWGWVDRREIVARVVLAVKPWQSG